MKKLVVLLLVVGLASVSFGGLVAMPNSSDLSATLNQAGTVLTIAGVVVPGAGNVWSIGVGYDGTITTVAASGTALAAAGGLGSVNTYPATNPTGFDFTAGDAGINPATLGNWITVGGITGLTKNAHLSLWDYGLDSTGNTAPAGLGYIVVQQVPEPITLALLGLGGLFIRRK